MEKAYSYRFYPTPEQEKKLEVAARRKNHRFGNRAGQSGQKSTTYKSKVIGLEEDTFDVGASSDPAKFSKPIKIHCNAGMSKTDLEGELGGMLRIDAVTLPEQVDSCFTAVSCNPSSPLPHSDEPSRTLIQLLHLEPFILFIYINTYNCFTTYI